jgi:hypothetical protein
MFVPSWLLPGGVVMCSRDDRRRIIERTVSSSISPALHLREPTPSINSWSVDCRAARAPCVFHHFKISNQNLHISSVWEDRHVR